MRCVRDVVLGETRSLTKSPTREQIAAYAEASGDRNPIHLDEAYARSAGLPGVIAHGLLTMAFAGELVAQWAEDPAAVRSLAVRFAGLVLPGDEVTCHLRVAEVAERDGVPAARLELWAVNQKGERVLNKGEAWVRLAENR